VNALPGRNALVAFVGRVSQDGTIVLNARRYEPAGRIRWSFVSIERERFGWRGDVSDDGGHTWTIMKWAVPARSRRRSPIR
jgi:hypothetical protein